MALRINRPPSETSDRIREAIEAVRPLSERFPADASWNLSRLGTLEAAVLCRVEGRDAADAWERASRSLSELSRLAPPSGLRALELARFHRRAAECAQSRDEERRALEEVRRGQAAIEDALQRDPKLTAAREETKRLDSLAERLASSAP